MLLQLQEPYWDLSSEHDKSVFPYCPINIQFELHPHKRILRAVNIPGREGSIHEQAFFISCRYISMDWSVIYLLDSPSDWAFSHLLTRTINTGTGRIIIIATKNRHIKDSNVNIESRSDKKPSDSRNFHTAIVECKLPSDKVGCPIAS